LDRIWRQGSLGSAVKASSSGACGEPLGELVDDPGVVAAAGSLS
jgi:hypothetical protein